MVNPSTSKMNRQPLRTLVNIPSKKEEDNCLKATKLWLQKQFHLPQNISDEDLLLFLHCSRYSLERTKNVIDAYYSIRTHTEMFQRRQIRSSKCEEALQVLFLLKFENKTAKGEKILFLQLIDKDTSKFDYIEVTRYALALLDVYINEDQRQSGYHAVVDLSGVTVSHLLKISPHMGLLRKELEYIKEALPFVLMGVHLINASSITEQLLNFVRPMLRPEHLELINIYVPDDFHKLHKIVPQEMFPQDMGGQQPPLSTQISDSIKKLKCNEDLIRRKELQVVDETRRSAKSKFSNDGYGLNGSFKTLSLD